MPHSPNRPQYSKLYGTAQWRKRASYQLKLEPLCAMCLRRGLTVSARVADHKVPHKGNLTSFFTGPLQSLCFRCHNSHKQADEQRGYSPEIGVNGFAIDPNHPSNQGERVDRAEGNVDYHKGGGD